MTKETKGKPEAVEMKSEFSTPGFAVLKDVEALLVKQITEYLEVFTGYETNNKYKVFNQAGNVLFTAVEESGCCCRQCCGTQRSFCITIQDFTGKPVFKLTRPVRCDDNWLCIIPNCCCQQHLTLTDMDDNLIGTIKQQFVCCGPKFSIRDRNDEEVMQVRGPECTFRDCCCCHMFHCLFPRSACCNPTIMYKVSKDDGDTEIGAIAKEYSGIVKESFSDADNFGIMVPGELPPDWKALLLAQVFLIDFMFFEDDKKSDPTNIVD